MLPFPEDLYFHREHTWVRREGETLYRVGVDEIFVRELGAILHADLPNEGDEVSQDETCGIIRGKTTKKLLCAPLSGEILDINQDLFEDLQILMEDPYGYGWILLLDPSDPEEELESLLRGEDASVWWENELALRRPATPAAAKYKTNLPPRPDKR
jgi:glycine cleavage system H protein